MDGQLVPWGEAKVHVLTHSLHYGVAVFEGIRCYPQPDGRGAIFRLREHIRRLFESAHICLMEMPYSKEQVAEACKETLRGNKLNEAYLRPIAYHSDGLMGVGAVNPVKLTVAAWYWGAYLGDEGLKKGIRVKISSYTRMHMNSDPTRATVTGHYLYSADEAFMCGTAAEITPVREVDDRRIGIGEMGPLTKEIQATFFRAVRGLEPRYIEWLTPVDAPPQAEANGQRSFAQ